MSNELIHTLSSIGQVSFSRYKELFKTLYRPEFEEDEAEVDHRNLIIRMLDSLGYFEFDLDSGKLFMCPPALVMMPTSGLPRLLLTGARTPSLIKKMKAAVKGKKDVVSISRQSQAGGHLDLPDVIFLEAADIDSARDVANRSGVFFSPGEPAGWKMVTSSVSINDIEARLSFVPRQDINWEKRIFDTENLRFTFPKGSTLHDNLLVEYTYPFTHRKMHWLWRGTVASEINRDWGRYLALNHCRKNIVIYDESNHYLGVPLTIPLPRILARAAALCSGKAPYIRRINCKEPSAGCNSLFYVYREVPQAVARVIAQKTRQEIMSTRIEFKRETLDYD